MKDSQNQDSQQKTLYEGSLVEVRLKAVGEQGALKGSDYEGIGSKHGLDVEKSGSWQECGARA